MDARPWLAALLLAASSPAAERNRILRPTDGAALERGRITAFATAPGGRLELDGRAVAAEQPVPGVLRAEIEATPGPHRLELIWPGGRREARFFVGPNAPASFKSYRVHPPVAVDCTRCHAAEGGRWRFRGGCFDCHARETFPQAHSHTADEMSGCGSCHNPHGSTERALLEAPRAEVCSRCHALR